MNEALVTDNIGLVHSFARPFRHRQDYEDVISAGIWGLSQAATHYKEAKGKFSTHAMYWIKYRILRYVTALAPTVRGTVRGGGNDRPGVASLDITIGESGVNCWVETIPDGYDYSADLYGEDVAKSVRAIVDAADDITPKQRAALLRVLDGGRLSKLEQTHLFCFRRSQSRSARKIKELLHDHLTA